MIRFQHEEEMAVQYELNIDGDVQKYAMSFLNIFNNARENHNTFYKVENCYDNRVFITCNKHDTDNVKKYLSQFGEIIGICDVKRIKILPIFSIEEYDKLYSEDYETQFAIED